MQFDSWTYARAGWELGECRKGFWFASVRVAGRVLDAAPLEPRRFGGPTSPALREKRPGRRRPTCRLASFGSSSISWRVNSTCARATSHHLHPRPKTEAGGPVGGTARDGCASISNRAIPARARIKEPPSGPVNRLHPAETLSRPPSPVCPRPASFKQLRPGEPGGRVRRARCSRHVAGAHRTWSRACCSTWSARGATLVRPERSRTR
jgi:hypothetical protein